MSEKVIPMAGLSTRECRGRLVLQVRDLGRDCGIVPGLGRRGVLSADLPRLAAKAIEDPCNATNPRAPSRDDLLALYEEAM